MNARLEMLKPDIVKRNNVTVFGRGPRSLVFANGFGCDQSVWRSVAPAFYDEFRVVLFDYVGSGYSDLNAYSYKRYSDLEGYADDVLEVCDALELHQPVFVGHSVGCMIGVLASVRAPRQFERLILVAPSPRYLNDPPDYVGGFDRADIEGLLDTMDRNFMGWASTFAPIIMGNPDRPYLGQELERRFCSTDPVIARQFAKATFFADNRADLRKVSVPSLVMQCSEDAIAPEAVGEYVHRSLPRSRLARLHATGHCPHMSHPDEVIHHMKEYLARSAR